MGLVNKTKHSLRDINLLSKLKGRMNTLKTFTLNYDFITYNTEEGVYRNGGFIPTIKYDGKATIRKIAYPYRELDIQTIVFEVCPEDPKICITQFITFTDENTLFYKAKRRYT